MTKDVILSFVRTLLTGFGAFLFGHNILTTTIDSSLWQEIVGAILAVGSTIWGAIDKTTTIEAIQSALRSLLTVGGGILVAAGKLTGDTLTAISGVVAPIVTFLYGILSKKKNALIAAGTLKPVTNTITDQTDLKKVA